MRRALAKSASEIARRAAIKSKLHPSLTGQKGFSSSVQFKHSSWGDTSPEDQHLQDDDGRYYSTFESTLDSVLKMTQLGKEEGEDSFHVARSVYTSDYHSEESACHICGQSKAEPGLCHKCATIYSTQSDGLPGSPLRRL